MSRRCADCNKPTLGSHCPTCLAMQGRERAASDPDRRRRGDFEARRTTARCTECDCVVPESEFGEGGLETVQDMTFERVTVCKSCEGGASKKIKTCTSCGVGIHGSKSSRCRKCRKRDGVVVKTACGGCNRKVDESELMASLGEHGVVLMCEPCDAKLKKKTKCVDCGGVASRGRRCDECRSNPRHAKCMDCKRMVERSEFCGLYGVKDGSGRMYTHCASCTKNPEHCYNCGKDAKLTIDRVCESCYVNQSHARCVICKLVVERKDFGLTIGIKDSSRRLETVCVACNSSRKHKR